MSFFDLFKAKENKKLRQIIKTLEEENEGLKKNLSPEYIEYMKYTEKNDLLKNEKRNLEIILSDLQQSINDIEQEIREKKDDLIYLNEELLFQEFGLYEPMYDFASAAEYKEKLSEIRNSQKKRIKNKTAVEYCDTWRIEGSVSKGEKFNNANIKQIIRSFNLECDSVIDKVKFNNFDVMKKRIKKSYDILNKLNEINRVSIRPFYLDLKLKELHLAYEYKVKKQEEKEEQRRIREELREQAKLEKELQEARRNIAKDTKHYSNALNAIKEQLLSDNLSDEKRQLLLEKEASLTSQLSELNEKLADIDYRQNNQKAGYVYIISNIGAFGEDIYKIGMTRRLNPQDRIDELGDASVPFKFDVHAMIFTEDAPALENALHKAFDDRKLNMVNTRREFFNVTLGEIETVVKANFDKTVEFTKIAEAEQYRESLKIREVNQK